MVALNSAPNKTEDFPCPIDLIAPDTLNPRKRFDEAALADLAESIKTHGLLEPIVVREVPPKPGRFRGDGYLIVAGERRWRACKLAGLAEVPIRNLGVIDDKRALELALVENLQRVDLDPIEEAEGYRQLNRVVGLTQAAIAAAVKRSQPAVANAMRLLELPEDVRALISAGELSVSHGVALARWKHVPVFVGHAARAVVEHRLTTKQTEQLNPNDWYMRGAARDLKFNPGFDTAVCEACPFGARWSTDGPYPYVYCLNPEHFDQLKAEAEAARAAEQTAKLAERGIDVAGVPRLEGMSYNSYRDLESGAPPGCSTDCPCRSQGVNRWGKVVPICLDPKRHAGLERAKTVAENKEKRHAEARTYARVAERIDGLIGTGVTRRELVVLVARAVEAVDQKPLELVIKRLGLYIEAESLKGYASVQSGKRWRTLMRLSDSTLIRLGVECLLAYDIQGQRNGVTSGSLVTWYLKAGTGADDAAPAEGGEDAS